VDGLAAGAPVDLGEFVGAVGEADLESFDFAEPAFLLCLGDTGDQVVADFGDAGPLSGVGPEHRAAVAGLTENKSWLLSRSLRIAGVPVLTDGDWQESWFAAVAGVVIGQRARGVRSVLDGAVAHGVLAELSQLLIECDQAEVEDVDAISEMSLAQICWSAATAMSQSASP